MSQQNQGFNNARLRTMFNDWKGFHPKTRNPAQGAKFPGQMFWEVSNSGKIILKFDDKIRSEGRGYQKKEIEMDYMNRNTLFEFLRSAATDPTFEKATFQVKKPGWTKENGRSVMSDQPQTQGEFTIIRSPEGVISLGYSKGDFKMLLDFSAPGFSEARKFVNGEYVPMTGELSQKTVLGYVNFVAPLLMQVEFEKYEAPAPKQNNNSGNNSGWGGGNNNNNNGGWKGGNSGGNSAPVDDFEDIPF